MAINAGDEWTKNAAVHLTLPYPTGSQGVVRLSNDEAAWSSPRAWAPTVSWSLTDTTVGGTDADGVKSVYVQWQNADDSWSNVGHDAIRLDRVAPQRTGAGLVINGGDDTASDWTVEVDDGRYDRVEDAMSSWWDWLAEFSIDGRKSWWPFENEFTTWRGTDLRTQAWGGNWEIGTREVCARYTDPAGNTSVASCDTIDMQPVAGRWPNLRFELPRPAVTGELYTIRPIYPPDFTIASTAKCRWILRWGDLESIFGMPNETFGQVWIERRPSTGACGEWAFSLPYTPGLWYHWTFAIEAADGSGIYYSPDHKQPAFHATVGTQQRGIPKSTIGLTYVLPDKYLTAVGEPVTYTLHSSEGYTAPTAAWWWATNLDGPESFSKWGGKTFTFTPTEEGAYWTGWTYETSTEYLRAEFDPPADKKRPTVTRPKAMPSLGGAIGDRMPVTLSWTATDPPFKSGRPGSGVKRIALQVSRNGGAWTKVTLPSAKPMSATVSLVPSGSYRYRVRAVDRAGNKSAWVSGPTFKPRLVQQSASSVNYAGAWSNVSGISWSGGSAKLSANSGAAARYTFTGRSVAWVADVASTRGLAQVYVDGNLAATIDLARAAAQGHRRVVFSRSWGSSAEHSIRIVVLGTIGRPEASVDAFVVLK